MKRKNKPAAVIYTPETESELTGYYALSNNGRYEDRMFLILGSSGEGFVLLTDGKRRRIAVPKRKSLKHLTLAGYDAAAAALIREEKLTDGAVRKMINQQRRNSEDKCSSESL